MLTKYCNKKKPEIRKIKGENKYAWEKEINLFNTLSRNKIL